MDDERTQCKMQGHQDRGLNRRLAESVSGLTSEIGLAAKKLAQGLEARDRIVRLGLREMKLEKDALAEEKMATGRDRGPIGAEQRAKQSLKSAVGAGEGRFARRSRRVSDAQIEQPMVEKARKLRQQRLNPAHFQPF